MLKIRSETGFSPLVSSQLSEKTLASQSRKNYPRKNGATEHRGEIFNPTPAKNFLKKPQR